MTRLAIELDTEDLSSILQSTSISTIAGLLAADPTGKAQAATRLAQSIVERLSPHRAPDRNQLALPL